MAAAARGWVDPTSAASSPVFCQEPDRSGSEELSLSWSNLAARVCTADTCLVVVGSALLGRLKIVCIQYKPGAAASVIRLSVVKGRTHSTDREDPVVVRG